MRSPVLYKIMFVLLFCYCSTSPLAAQHIKVCAELDSSSIQIGQQAKLTLSIQYKVDTDDRIKIQWPVIGDTLRKEVEVVNQSKIDTVIPDRNDPFTCNAACDGKLNVAVTATSSPENITAPLKVVV